MAKKLDLVNALKDFLFYNRSLYTSTFINASNNLFSYFIHNCLHLQHSTEKAHLK